MFTIIGKINSSVRPKVRFLLSFGQKSSFCGSFVFGQNRPKLLPKLLPKPKLMSQAHTRLSLFPAQHFDDRCRPCSGIVVRRSDSSVATKLSQCVCANIL